MTTPVLTEDGKRLAEALVKADHEFKAHPTVFHPARRGDKTFEFRKDDRGGYHVGQTVCLRCYATETGYTDDAPLCRVITDILRPGEFGLQDGYCILSLRPLTAPEGEGAGLREALAGKITHAREYAACQGFQHITLLIPLEDTEDLLRALASPQPAVQGPVAAGVEYTDGVYDGSLCIFRGGRPMSHGEVLDALNALTPADPKTPDAGVGLREALVQCAAELATLHHGDCDLGHAEKHSAGLRMARVALAQPAPAGEDETGMREATLSQNWLAEEFASAEAEVAQWPPGLRASFGVTHGAPQQPKAETPAGVGDDLDRAKLAFHTFYKEPQRPWEKLDERDQNRWLAVAAVLKSDGRAREVAWLRMHLKDAADVFETMSRRLRFFSLPGTQRREIADEASFRSEQFRSALTDDPQSYAVVLDAPAALSTAPAARPGDGLSGWLPVEQFPPRTRALFGRWTMYGTSGQSDEHWNWEEATGTYHDYEGERFWNLDGRNFLASPFYGKAPTHAWALPTVPAERPVPAAAPAADGGRA